MKKIFTLFALFALALPAAVADEGMWIPMLLGKNQAAMQRAGMRITAQDIYDINNACLKDAVILFNQGCTGEFVSDQGLFLTNHHCGYSYITAHSTVEHDYLTHGFWAMTREQEIPCKGLTATRLVRMEDVTNRVLSGINDKTSEEERERIVKQNITILTTEAVAGTHYKAIIKPFYYGNQYFMYINEVFTDVRLVGAPPSNIGKFGGDTDNWMWPRHTGDFSMFRVYADRDGKPADYSSSNVPYKPLKHLDISLRGVDEGDFTFVFGYPGTTQRYVTHNQMELQAIQENPIRIALRDIRLNHYKAAMELTPAQRLKYASKVASIANGWKKWQGETLGINRLDGVGQKKAQEAQFQAWANNRSEYKNVLRDLNSAYGRIAPIEIDWVYFTEGVMASDLMNRANHLFRLANTTDDAEARAMCDRMAAQNETFFADFAEHTLVDRAIFIDAMNYVYSQGHAPYIDQLRGKMPVDQYLAQVYDKSILTNSSKLLPLLKKYTPKQASTLLNDPAVKLFVTGYTATYTTEKEHTYDANKREINRLMRTYVRGMMQQYPDSNFFPDANLTLRVAYGHVQGFRPKDAMYYTPYSTLQGIIEKENPDIYDYVVEPKLKQLYNTKDYGRYANLRGEMPVAFIATNHTTGGNSGSPVLNADGQLIGINFDRCWEGTMSDLLFDPNYCRNISLDIRYCLFIIDKFAGATHLVDEMTIVQ
ncbi:MAG: S46 family peptidase [Bacteroidales bacterium]|nr:S46 family peptidase [Candidatus Colimorpha merdihippi]MCQ2281963.1 S46 family peptidase [Bacteroidales bacterium]